jgi:hypothetical protein
VVEQERAHADRPTSFAVFVGRAPELARLTAMVAEVPATIVVGVPGVGKSALAHAFAARWPGTVVRQRVTGAPPSALLDDVRRQLSPEVVDDLASDEERAADIARRLTASDGLWLLDDFHRLADDDQARLLDAFAAAAAGKARLVATSRQAPLPRAGVGDHAQLRLEPLDEPSGRTLWLALDELYGAADGFDVAWRRSHGLPILLRQAHAGGFDQEDPIEGAVRALDEDERWLAGALALSEVPLPAESLLDVRPAARSALRRLVSRFVVDIDGAGQCTLHDLFAASVRSALNDDERRTLHVVVARALAKLPLDPAIRVRNVCAHLVAAGRAGEAADWLVQQAGELVRRGAAAELLRAIDAVAPDRRPLPLRVERARALLRVLDFGGALAEFRALAASGQGAPEELTISLAQVALLTGDARLAYDTLAEIIARPAAGLRRRARAAVTLAVASSYLGEGDAGRRCLAALEPQLADPDQAAVLAAYRAFTLWIEERDDDASDAVRMMTLPPAVAEPTSYRAAAIPAIFGAIAARQGRLEEADRSLVRSQKVLSRRSDPLFQLELGFGRALYHHEAGERIDAVKRLTTIHDSYARSGYLLGTLFVGGWLARTLLVLGRRVEALDRLARIEETARARGLVGIVDAAARTRRYDPLRQLVEPLPLPAPTRRGLYIRARMLAALSAAAAGETLRARDLVGAPEPLTPPGYALDRAIAHVVDAAIARLDGDGAAVEAALARAVSEAQPGAVDAFDSDLPRALVDAVGRVRVIDAAARRLAVSAVDELTRATVVIDARTHELRTSAITVALRGRPIVRRLLYALAASAGRALSKEALAAAAWEREYSPLVHDNPLKSNVGHLRRLVADAGLTVAADELGYRLELPEGAIFIDAV